MCQSESECGSLFHYADGERKRWTDLPQDPDSPAYTDNDDSDDANSELLAADPAAMLMPTELLPQKNTFVHFEDEELPTLHPNRSVTCPGSIVRTGCDSYPPESENDLSDGEHTPAPTFLGEGKKRWADLSEDEQTPANHKAQGHQRWADLSEDEQTPAHQKLRETKRWVDLSEDGLTPAHEKCPFDGQSTDLEESAEETDRLIEEDEPADLEESAEETPRLIEDDAPKVELPRSSRPQFAKPTREARSRQFQAKLDEFFGLDFDEVDPSQQDGLTHRMLFGLKSLGELVNFWQADGTQVSEEGFKLVGLEEADMYALGRVIRKADKMLEERRFRDAYDKLCTARRWFEPETRMEERAKAAAHADKKEKKEKNEKKDKKKVSDSDDDDWTQVKKKDKKKVSDSHDDDWTQVKKDKKTARQEAPKKEQPSTRTSTQISNLKPQSSNLNPQTSGIKTPNGQGRKGPQKLLCRYNVCVEQDRAFNVVRKLLGDRGSHMKTIAQNTGAKLRIRGRGSGFLEGPEQKEASDEPLMICISAATREGFDNAVEDIESLLAYVHDQYREFCQDRKLPAPKVSVVQREQPTY
jgi:hypothetical protein